MYTTTEQRALTYYRADLNRIAPLTREEEATLVERLRLAHDHTLPPDIVTQAKQRLVEGMQRLVLFLALKQAPRFVRQDLEDLTQEASLALLEATERCVFVRESFSGYASYVIRRAFATAWTRDFPVSITRDVLLELPLRVDAGQSKRLRAHFEAARCFYNALLGEAIKRLRAMRADPAWQEARAIPQAHKQERKEAFTHLRQAYGFSEYALHDFAKEANCTWIAHHIDSMLAQTLATRAYRAANQVCLGKAKKVRFRSKGRGLDSVENKWNRSGLRFMLQPPEEGNQGWMALGKDHLPALIDWDDPVVCHGLRHPIKYARLVRRKASSPQAQGADAQGYRYYAQLILEGKPHQKKKHSVGSDVVGLDLGPSTIAIVPQEGEAQLLPLCEELKPDARAKRRLERKLDRQRRANNPQNYDEKGRIKKRGKGKRRLVWKNSKGYLATRRCLASKERKLAAHRKSLHGRKVHEIIAMGTTVILEKISYASWQIKAVWAKRGTESPRDVCSTLETHRVRQEIRR